MAVRRSPATVSRPNWNSLTAQEQATARAKARSRALTRLKDLYPLDFERIHAEERTAAGIPLDEKRQVNAEEYAAFLAWKNKK